MIKKEKQYCSLASPDLEMAGTADPVDVWLLLEYPMSWKAKVLDDNELAAETQQWLLNTIEQLKEQGLKVRPQFIRQPEYERSSMRFILATANTCWQLEGPGYSYLHDLDICDYLQEPPQGAETVQEPVYLVCMNGQRDQCCARFGRPIYTALREQFGERVWQVSHLGGHRFAANVLTLPQGGVYGRVTEELVDDFASTVERDQLHFECLRGVGWYSKAMQAAQVFAKTQRLSPVSMQQTDAGSTEVSLEGANGENLTITVGQTAEPVMALASCKDDQPKPVHPYVLIN